MSETETIAQLCEKLQKSKYNWLKAENPPQGIELFLDMGFNDDIILRLKGPLDRDLLEKASKALNYKFEGSAGLVQVISGKKTIVTIKESEFDTPTVVLVPPYNGADVMDEYLRQKNG